MANETIQRYQIKEKIGAGGMGTVYRAWDRELERDVALKWLPAYFSEDENFSERFKREIRVIAHLEHPHIVPIYDVGESESRPFIIMRLLDGGTLRNKIQQGNFNLAELVQAMEQIAEALAAAHARQIIHRDIKPGNILFDNRGSAFLSDFGIAKVLDSGTQLTGTGFIGTPAYMSPEQFTGRDIDGRSDQYSLAVVVYEALKGDLPFEGTTAQMMYQHINEEPPDIDLDKHPIPPGLNPILLKSLSKDPAGRYARITDFTTAMAIAMRMDPATSSVLLPVMVGPPPSRGQTPPTSPTELDTSPEEMDTVGNDYRAGLEALALGEWATALVAFDRVLDVDPDYGNAAEFSRQAQTGLEKATLVEENVVEETVIEESSIEKTNIEAAPTPAKAGAAAAAVAIDKTILEPGTAASDVDSAPASTPPSAPPAQETGRKLPIWALALIGLLLVIGCGIVASQLLGGNDAREPSAAGGVDAVAGAAVAGAAVASPRGEVTETAAPPASATSLPKPVATAASVGASSIAADAGSHEGADSESPEGVDGNAKAQSEDQTPQPVVGYAETEVAEESPTEAPTEEPPTEAPTEEPPTEEAPAQPAAVRVIVSSANLRRGPGTIYPTTGAIFSGEEATVLATNRDRTWYNILLADGRRAWLAASVTEAVNAAAVNSAPVAATIPAAPTLTPVPPTATPLPTLPPPPTSIPGDGGGGGGGDDGGGGGGDDGGSEPPPKYTAEPP